MKTVDMKDYITKEETERDFLKKEDAKEKYVSKNTFEKKAQEIEATLDKKITKADLPDHSIYATKEEIPDLTPYLKKNELPPEKDLSEYAKKSEIPDVTKFAKKENIEAALAKKADKSDLDSLAKKSDLPDLKPYIKKENLPDFNTLATKAELELKASIADLSKKVAIEDLEKYKRAIDESLKSKTNKSETYTRQEVKDRYVKKETHQNDLEKKMDRIELPDFDTFAKKSDIQGLIDKDCVDLSKYAKKEEIPIVEHAYCFVKLVGDFVFYDGMQDDHECYMGERGHWETKKIFNGNLQKPNEFVYWTPFDGIYNIDFSCTVRRDTHLCKPAVTLRVRTSGQEITLHEYFDNKSVATGSHNDVTLRTFNKATNLWLPKGSWVRFSMQFSNRSHLKRKNWIHCVGSSQVQYNPTYFCIYGRRVS